MQAPNALMTAVMRDMAPALADVGVTGVVIGGVAVGMVSVPRFTEDLDALIIFDTSKADLLLRALEAHNFRVRFEGMADLAVKARMVTVIHAPTAIPVDIALGCLPFEEEVLRRATAYGPAALALRLPTPEDLIILKAIASRPKDLEDIRNIAAIHRDLDRGRIRHWVTQYGDLLDEPDLWSRIEPLL